MKAFALYNLKGGVGKTTSCVNLAYLAAKDGYKTLLWDIDPQGASTHLLEGKAKEKGGIRKLLQRKTELDDLIRETEYENLYLIPGDLSMHNVEIILDDLKKSKSRFKKLLSTIKKDYDYVFIDCPPTLNLLAENVFKASDFVLLPMIPSTLSAMAYERVYQFFENNEYNTKKIIPFFTLVDGRKKIHNDTISNFREAERRLMRATIPYSAVIERMSLEQAPVHSFSPRSTASTSYRNLWQELKWFRKSKTAFHPA